MIYSGTDLKFRISSTIAGFVPGDHDFRIEVIDNYGRKKAVCTKDDCFYDADGNWYFTLENVRRGILYARFYAIIPDDDYDKQSRVVTDFQLLCTVDLCESCLPKPGHCHGQHSVKYEQVWTVNADDGTYLAGADGQLVLTADGKRIQIIPH